MKTCIICEKEHSGAGKTCGKPCKHKLISLNTKGKCGGYREGSGRAKTGYFKGIYCGSTYELIWVIYQIDHDIPFERFPSLLEWNGIKYIPDFLQDNKIIELKGFESDESVSKKTAVANHHGYEVVVLRKENLQKEFDWVKENYKYKNVFELYDEYKPKYSYSCSCCGIDFKTDSKKITEDKFCGRVCAGKFRKQVQLRTDDWREKISKSMIGKKNTSKK